MPQNKITFGLRNVHYALANQDSNGNWSFDTPVALPGAQEFSSEVVGGSTNVYADDTLYGKVTSFKSVDILFHLIYALHKPFFGEDKTYEDFMGMLDFKVLSNVEELNRVADVIGRMLGDAKNNGNSNNFIPKK